MSQQTTRAAAHAWWVTGRPELNDLCPLQLILGQGLLAAGAEEPTKYQAEMLAEPWNKRYARLLDSQCMPDDEMSPAADNNARGALTDEQLGRFLLPLMRKHLSPVAIDHLTLGDEPTIGMRKLTRALLTEARSDGFRDCIDAIRGAIEFGKQDVNHAPTEHWLAEFWDIGRKLAAPRQPGEMGAGVPEGFVVAPHYRGYARLGAGAYLLNHSKAGTPAELVISMATDEEKAGRVVGDERDNPDGYQVQPEAMAVRLRFENVAGLDALEQQLRHLRDVHFPASAQQDEREAVIQVVKDNADGIFWRGNYYELPISSQQVQADARFFMDHGLWHDRVTGQHMYTQDQYDELRRNAFHNGYASRNEEIELAKHKGECVDKDCQGCSEQVQADAGAVAFDEWYADNIPELQRTTYSVKDVETLLRENVRAAYYTRPAAESDKRDSEDSALLLWLMKNVNCDEIEGLDHIPFGLTLDDHFQAFRDAIRAAMSREQSGENRG